MRNSRNISATMSLFLLFFFLLANSWMVSPQANPQPKTIFLLAGQSNMAGRGGVTNDTKTGKSTWDGIIPPQCQPNPSILRLDVNLNWVQAKEPLHADIDSNRTNGIGPGMPFARAILNDSPSFGTIGLVPCAYGGSHISQWQRGTELYNKLIKRATAALKDGGEIGGLLWWQGGADIENAEDANSFKDRATQFFNDVRVDLKSPDLPIIQVALARGMKKYAEIVRGAQLSISLHNLKTLDPPTLPTQPDHVHLTSESQVNIGSILAKEYLSIRYLTKK